MTSKVASTVAYAGRSERFHVPFTRRADRRSQCTHTISLQHEQLAVELKIGFAPVGAIRCIKPAKNSFLKRKNIAVRSTSMITKDSKQSQMNGSSFEAGTTESANLGVAT
jgi:hypothetical protein